MVTFNLPQAGEDLRQRSHGAGLRFACGSLGITSFLQRCHQVFVAGNQHTGLCSLIGASFYLRFSYIDIGLQWSVCQF